MLSALSRQLSAKSDSASDNSVWHGERACSFYRPPCWLCFSLIAHRGQLFLIILCMRDAELESTLRLMRGTAMGIFRYALAEASIAKAFARQVRCERGALRICEDLYDLQSYSSVRVISIGKAGHTMVEALAELVGASALEGIVASSLEPASQVHGFRYFRGGHPMPNGESIQAARAMLKLLQAQTAASLVIYLLSGGGSSIVEKPIDDEI